MRQVFLCVKENEAESDYYNSETVCFGKYPWCGFQEGVSTTTSRKITLKNMHLSNRIQSFFPNSQNIELYLNSVNVVHEKMTCDRTLSPPTYQ